MSLYPAYLKEREGLEVLETELGFATYKFRGADCYIQDIYVLPEYRKIGVASELADIISAMAVNQGVHILTGSVDSNALGCEASRAVLRAYGMSPYTQEGPITYYRKEI